MVFDDLELSSMFDIENVEHKDMNLNILSKEIDRITNLIHDKIYKNQNIKLSFNDNNHRIMFLDYQSISKYTWDRDLNEIREILYRKPSDKSKHFCISKSLKQFGIDIPIEEPKDPNYLKLLYLFYILNYFVFPKLNIFKFLNIDNQTFEKSFDEGTEEGYIVSIILNNLLRYVPLKKSILVHEKEISKKSDEVCMILDHLINNDLIDNNYDIKEFNLTNDYNNPIYKVYDYLYSYSMNAYCKDLKVNLEIDNIFKFDENKVHPYEHWKKKYIFIEGIDDFLKDDFLYSFCKQKEYCKVESREKKKFLDSNAVNFLKVVIQYDIDWINEFDSDEGLYLQKKDDTYFIYALKLAVIIKTYNDLINEDKQRIISQTSKVNKPLRALLSWNNHNRGFAATLPIRYFNLACHSEYLNAIMDHDKYYERFRKEFIIPEILSMNIFIKMYKYKTFESRLEFLDKTKLDLMQLID